MRFVTVGPTPPADLTSSDKTSAAWVESEDVFVDVAAAYTWSCQSIGRTQDSEQTHVLADLSRVVRDWRNPDRWKRLQHLRDTWRAAFERGDEGARACLIKREDVRLHVPFLPNTFRDFYAFETHVKTCRARRGLAMVPEWYHFPVFYFSNPGSFRGPEDAVWAPVGCHELDFELEVACVIGQPGTSLESSDADRSIAGYCILNDWSARDLQREEVKVGLGPAKGKDFATSFGPYFVTADELSDVAEATTQGLRHRLQMHAAVNGRTISSGNLYDLHYTFAEMIHRASADVTLFAGDVIGSGTVGTGCILEVGPEVQPWLRAGDEVTLSVERLGTLRTPIVSAPSKLS